MVLTIIAVPLSGQAQNPYNLWLQYDPVENSDLRNQYLTYTSNIHIGSGHPTQEVIREELTRALSSMLGEVPRFSENTEGGLYLALKDELPAHIKQEDINWNELGNEGFIIKTLRPGTILIAATDYSGLLYGSFSFLKKLQMHQDILNLDETDSPGLDLRILNHWDNLDRSVERGYAGFSIWNWHLLPGYEDPRYKDYARANASIGINGTVLTNVNANALILTPPYLEKVKALADIFRPYHLKVYLTARFSAPIEIGGLETADPLDPAVKEWWKKKADEIYEYIPDFGGFLVKANSEGQPGPQNYGRNHADGANMLAEAVAPHNGIVMWRAFVYSEDDPQDRAMQAYDQFMPLDGQFRENVLIQVKNGPVDFQPREPFHPLFGAMKSTQVMMEFQITQEYLGFSSHLVYMPQLFEEVLDEDTYQGGKGMTVAKTLEKKVSRQSLTGMAGVANIGNDLNWTGHPMAQSGWYGYGRLAWDPELSSSSIAEEWLGMTFTPDSEFTDPMTGLLINSRESVVKYMTPLGLHHIMGVGHHYGPAPWVNFLSRPEWNSVYYHQADSLGIGFDRTISGSNALGQYAPEVAKKYSDPETCPKEYLLWFHHLPWNFEVSQDTTLWQAIGLTYQEGVDEVEEMNQTWRRMENHVDEEVFRHVSMLLNIQLEEAKWWKNACMSYFQDINGLDYPEGMEPPDKPLTYYKSLIFPYAPGIRPSWR